MADFVVPVRALELLHIILRSSSNHCSTKRRMPAPTLPRKLICDSGGVVAYANHATAQGSPDIANVEINAARGLCWRGVLVLRGLLFLNVDASIRNLNVDAGIGSYC
jgi:hypothetical protein